MPERICKVAHEYSGVKRAVGDRYDVEAKDVALLLTLGWIESQESDRGYVGREMTSEEPTQYRTREMKSKKRK